MSTAPKVTRPSEPEPAAPVSTDRPLTARRTFIVLAVVLVVAFSLLFFYTIRQVIAWVLVASLLAVALDPAVRWLTRHGWRRGLAAIFVSLVFFAIVAGVLVGLTAPFITQAKELITNLPGFLRSVFAHGPLKSLHIYQHLKSVSAGSVLRAIGGGSVFSAVSMGISLIFAAVTVFTLMVMLLIEGPRVWGGFVGLFNDERREWVGRLGERVGDSVGGYVRGNLFISVIAASVAYVALLLLRVPYPLPLALLVGVFDIIPLVGATIAAVICVIVAFTHGLVPGIGLTVFFVVYQQLENSFIQPYVYSRTVSLSPLMVLLASLVGATIAGILGVLMAIPMASALLIFVDEYQARRGAVASWEVLQPLERIEADAPEAEDVLQTEEETKADEEAEGAAAGADLRHAEVRHLRRAGDKKADEGPPERIRDEVDHAEDERPRRKRASGGGG
jgi:predicted PurR-regulated permease PerM